MHDGTLAAVAQRLDRLERENRRWRFLTFGAVAMIGVVLLLGATSVTDEIRAKRFLVIAKDGTIRAKLGVDMDPPFDSVSLALYPKEPFRFPGGPLSGVFLSVLQDGGPRLSFWDKKGRNRVWLHAAEDGASNFYISRERDSEHDRGSIVLYVGRDGEPWLGLHDSNGRSRALLGSTELERPQPGVIEKRPVSSIVLFDKDGKVVWRAP